MITFFEITFSLSTSKCWFTHHQLLDREEKVGNRREKFQTNVMESLIIEYKNKSHLKFIK